MKKLLLLLFCLVQISTGLAQILAPQVLSAGGASGTTSLTKISYTIGQTITTAGNSTGSQLTQGFQQSNLPLLDSLPCYEIGEIPPQTVFQGTEKLFYICTKSWEVIISMQYKSEPPSGEMTFNTTTKRFAYIPAAIDRGTYEVTFYAVLNQDTVYQDVPFTVFPALPREQTTFGLKPSGPIPADDDDGYVIYTEVKGPKVYFNHSDRETYDISIAGKTLVFDKQVANKLQVFCNNSRKDLKELTLYAEKIIVRCPLLFPQTNLTVFARTLIFEDGAEKANINTQPDAATKNQGDVNGANAGNITLHVQELISDYDLRFRLLGGAGTGAGNGGNGGVFTANMDFQAFMDAAGGAAGDRGGGLKGQNGRFQIKEGRYDWLHPYALRLVMAHAKVAYLNNHLDFTQKVAVDYLQQIEDYANMPEWRTIGDENQTELGQLKDEIAGILNRIANNQDYFGNSVVWVPMLSFEVNKIAFEEEVEHGIKILFLCDLLKQADVGSKQKESALQLVRKQQEELIVAFQNAYSEAIDLLPQLEAQADAVATEIEIIQQDLAKLEQELIERAKYVVEERHKPPKRSLWRKIVGTVGAIAQVVPVYQPALGVIGTGLQVISNLDFGKPIDAIKEVYNVAKDIGQIDFKKSLDSLKSVVDSLDFRNISSGKKLLNYAKNIGTFIGPLVTTLADLREKTGPTKVPFEEIQVELDKMRAESPEFTDLTNRTNDLMQEKLQFQQTITSTLQNITKLANDIQAALVTIDGINIEVFNTASKRDLRAMIYVKDMEERAKERLTRYHYYMAKAYEYRLLEAYDQDLNLAQLFERFKVILKNKGENVELTPGEFESLKAIFIDVLSNVTANILRKYNDNAPEISTPVSFFLEQEDLAQLNSGQPVQLNLVDRGWIQPYEEAPRIREFKVESIKMHVENGKPGSLAYFDIVMEHSGLSKLKKNGQVYVFNHYNNKNTNPITWSARYDVRDQSIATKNPSPSVTSLLKSLLDRLGNFSNENLELYSRPSAWADIIINKYDNSSNGIKMVIDEIRFKVIYDFHQIPSNLVSLEVVTNKELKPLIHVSISDKNQRQEGWGSFIRTYFRNTNSSLDISAPKQYGVWAFENWTDFHGKIVSERSEISVSLGDNKMLRANYKLIQPKLFVQNDTIRLLGKAGMQKVSIKNVGTGEMTWTCSGSNDWIDIQPDSTGVNDGEITFSFKENLGKTSREQKLLVIAPSSVRYLDTITVIQSPLLVSVSNPMFEQNAIAIHPNPTRDEIKVEIKANLKTFTVKLFDSQGKIHRQLQVKATSGVLNVADLASGIYFLEILANNTRTVRTVVLQ